MTCEEALLAISAALDGELPPRERAKLSEHLVACESCRELAEDLRVLTDALEDSDREPPAGLAEAVRNAVAAEPPVRKRRPPYPRGRLGLRTVAAMLALCVGLGGIGLFVSGRAGSGADSAPNGAAPALFQAPQAAPASQAPQAAPEEMEKSAATDCDGLSDEAGAVGYSVAGGGDPAEAPMEAAPSPSEEDIPMPSSAPSAMVEVRGGGGPSSDGGSDGAGPTSDGEEGDDTQIEEAPAADNMNGEEKLSITPEEALELVFQYVGGYTQYPKAQLLSQDGTVLGYLLKTVETDSDISEWHLDYAGPPPEGEGYYFHFYKIVTDQQEDPSSTCAPTLDWFTVSPDGRISMKYPMDD